MIKKAPTGIIHGRFQPPHKGHIRALLAGTAHAEHLYIGICTPEICSEAYAAETGYPCTAAENPYTYAERVEMITLALSEAGVSSEHYSFLEFPSDYYGAETIVPPGTVFFLSQTSQGDTRKAEHLQSLGLPTEVVLSLPFDEWRERSSDVRKGLLADTADLEKLVPAPIAAYLKARGVV